MCKFHLLGLCSKGPSCHFAHAREDLNPLPDLYRTKLCKSLINTGQCNDSSCKYAHNREELRSPGIPAPRSAARGQKGEKAARGGGRTKGAAKTTQRLTPSVRGGGASAVDVQSQVQEGSGDPPELSAERTPADQSEVMMGMTVMTYPVLGVPGNRNGPFQLVMPPQMTGSPSSGIPPYGMMLPPEKAAQMWYCGPSRPLDGDGSSTTAKTVSNQNPQDPSRTSSNGSDGSLVEPSDGSSGTPPFEQQVWGVPFCTGAPKPDGSPSAAVMQGKFPDVYYNYDSTGVVPGVTVKNTFIEFQPVKPSSGLRNVHTASGRLDMLGGCQEEMWEDYREE